SFDESKVKGYKHFANKLWNITRYILENTAGAGDSAELVPGDKLHLDTLDALTKDVTDDFDNYRVYLAAEKLYHYIWHELADKILEESKPILVGKDAGARASRQALLLKLLDRVVRLLHPFMPFVTEEIYASLPTKNSSFLMVAPWPEPTPVTI